MAELKGRVMLDSCLIRILLATDDIVFTVMAQTEEDLTENIERGE